MLFVTLAIGLEEQSDQGLHCLHFSLHLLEVLLCKRTFVSKFRVITADFVCPIT